MFIFSMFRFRSYLPTLKGYGLVNVDLSSHLQVSGEKIHAAWKRRKHIQDVSSGQSKTSNNSHLEMAP